MRSSLLFSGILLGITACSSSPLSSSQKKSLHEYSVAVAWTPDLAVQTGRFDDKGIETKRIRPQTWNVADLLESEFESQSKPLGIRVQNLKLDSAKTSEKYEKGRSFFKRLAGKTQSELRDYALSEARNKKVSNVLLILPDENADYPIYAPGYGVFCKSNVLVPGDAQAFFMARVELWHLDGEKQWFEKVYSPADASVAFSKSCEEIEKMPEADLLSISKGKFTALSHEWVKAILARAGLEADDRK